MSHEIFNAPGSGPGAINKPEPGEHSAWDYMTASDRALLDALSDYFCLSTPQADGSLRLVWGNDPRYQKIVRAVADYRDARGAP